MNLNLPETTDNWILEQGPRSDVVVSSRARLARNLPDYPFAPRARKEQLAAITDAVHKAIEASPHFKSFRRIEVSKLSTLERRFLRESHLISSELEKGRDFGEVYVSDRAHTSIMINEEDHLRMQTLRSGLQISEVYQAISEIEEELEKHLHFAYNPLFGYLTACPTNTGTGLRVSVMLHLVGLVMTNQIEESLSTLSHFGLVVRGAYGEHSAHSGDLFQISNEITLGKSEEELVQILEQVVGQIIEREMQAREMLFKHAATKCEDAIQRAIGILRHAKSMDSNEAVTLLSRVRLGVGREGGPNLTHPQLNRLLIDVQPAHLRRGVGAETTEDGDIARAALLRARLVNGGNEPSKS